jgi:hypothetical protein
MTEGERTSAANDLKIIPTLIGLIRHSNKAIAENALKLIMILGENNPKQVLPEFQQKGKGIKHCVDIYMNDKSDKNAISHAVVILTNFAVEGYI